MCSGVFLDDVHDVLHQILSCGFRYPSPKYYTSTPSTPLFLVIRSGFDQTRTSNFTDFICWSYHSFIRFFGVKWYFSKWEFLKVGIDTSRYMYDIDSYKWSMHRLGLKIDERNEWNDFNSIYRIRNVFGVPPLHPHR